MIRYSFTQFLNYWPLAFLMLCCTEPTSDHKMDLGWGQWVNPLIGTAGHGHVYPGATVPFGMVQLSPDNGTEGWDWCSGYHYSDSVIVGFSHTHLSGTGIGDLCDISIMPTTSRLDLASAISKPRESFYAATFSHEQEVMHPGYYRVMLDNGIDVELTASKWVGFHRYNFPEGHHRRVLLDLGFHINWDRPVETTIIRQSEKRYLGWRKSSGWAQDQRVYFAMHFSEAPEEVSWADSSEILTGGDSIRGQKVRSMFDFGTGGAEISIKIGLSSASVAGAIAALDSVVNLDFTLAHGQAIDQWNKHLGRIEASSYDSEILKNFYTALYHTQLAPIIYEDAIGEYKAPNGRIENADTFTRYDIFSLWDTFRAAHPLATILQPDRVNDFVQSLLAHYLEYGRLPVWSLWGNETHTMTGYHAVPVIVDAYFKGFRDYSRDLAYEAMKTSAMQNIRGTDLYRQYGYIPYDRQGQSVTKTLEYAYDDWCIGRMAFVLGKMEEHNYFEERSKAFRHLFDPSTGFMRAKLADGSWMAPFDPNYSDHNFDIAAYTEGNAWQHSWFVPHDVRSLIDLHGGREAFVKKLDLMFSTSSELTGDNVSADISGLIGQYAHGNEPSHHIAYLYNYAGAPWKTQEVVRQILETQYDSTAAGLCGNEDCGQMSAWYVFSALGFYPVNPAEGIYVIGTPLLTKAVIQLPEGKSFTVRARFLTHENKYIQTATLNEAPLTRSYLRHFEIMDGGELILEMGPQPNYLHWVDEQALPPSASDPDDGRY